MFKKIDQALKERYEICAKHSPAVSILVFLSEAQPHGGTEFPGLHHAIIKQTRCKGWYRKEMEEAGPEKSRATQSCEEL